MHYVERLGIPAVFCVWLMTWVMRELREIRSHVHKQTVLLAVISATLDVPEPPAKGEEA